uniref:Extracellular ligand-binding receptor n=1 Tax=mine drainage metagenome TaxID=410659 RepID=E6QIK1_9ZZZZ
MILKQMRSLGMKQRVFGSYRTLGPTLLADAGPAAEGFEAVFPYDPTRKDPRWTEFQSRFAKRFGEQPEQFASLAYDAMNQLLDSICEAGLNRARIHDALAQIGSYNGVTGHMVYDPNLKNVSPMYLGDVHDGAITYRLERIEKQQTTPSTSAGIAAQQPAKPAEPYAYLPEVPVSFAGPAGPDSPVGPIRVVIFGRGATAAAHRASVAAAIPSGWELLPIDSGQNWGVAATELVQGLMEQHALAIVAMDRDAAHLSAQLALKSFVPVVAITDDRTLTSTNVPWVFRLPASTSPEAALKVLKLAELKSGANPDRLRSVLASGEHFGKQFFAVNGEPGKPQM